MGFEDVAQNGMGLIQSMTDVASRVSKFWPDIKMHPLKPGLVPEHTRTLHFEVPFACEGITGRISDGFPGFPIPQLGFRMFRVNFWRSREQFGPSQLILEESHFDLPKGRRMYDDPSMADWTWWTWWNCKVIIPHMVSQIWCGIYMDQLVDKSTNNWRFTWQKCSKPLGVHQLTASITNYQTTTVGGFLVI